MPPVTASESGAGQTELPAEAGKDVEFGLVSSPHTAIRSPLESGASKGDSPVREAGEGNGGYPEYRSSNLERECGCH